MHAGLAKIVDQSPLLTGKVSAHDGQIPPDRSMREELAHESISGNPVLGEEKNSRRKAIDAVNGKDRLMTVSQMLCQERKGRRRI
jgi:hypothetical protein